jgi:hypothetical protein
VESTKERDLKSCRHLFREGAAWENQSLMQIELGKKNILVKSLRKKSF